MTDRLKIGQEVLIHGYVDEIRKDTVIVRNEGGYFGTVECEVTDIEMPDTNKVLDKIREQIKSHLRGVEITLEVLVENDPLRPKMEGAKDTLEECLNLIDKAESEGSK